MKSLRLAGVLVELREFTTRHGAALEITLYDVAENYVFIEQTRVWRDFRRDRPNSKNAMP